jgi:hypothetical protein
LAPEPRRLLGAAAVLDRELPSELLVFGSIPSGVWLARTKLELGELALAWRDHESAVAHLAEARAEAAKAGLSAMVGRIDGFLSAA